MKDAVLKSVFKWGWGSNKFGTHSDEPLNEPEEHGIMFLDEKILIKLLFAVRSGVVLNQGSEG